MIVKKEILTKKLLKSLQTCIDFKLANGSELQNFSLAEDQLHKIKSLHSSLGEEKCSVYELEYRWMSVLSQFVLMLSYNSVFFEAIYEKIDRMVRTNNNDLGAPLIGALPNDLLENIMRGLIIEVNKQLPNASREMKRRRQKSVASNVFHKQIKKFLLSAIDSDWEIKDQQKQLEQLVLNWLKKFGSKLLDERAKRVFFEVDVYGFPQKVDLGWENELSQFVKNLLALEKIELAHQDAYNLLFKEIEKLASQKESKTSSQPNKVRADKNSAIEFEKKCCEKIASLGWQASLTKATGDQGADIICEKNSIRVACQVKLYESKVGNKAVQEAHAAKIFYDCDMGVVIAINGFTSSAKNLAAKADVVLLDYSQLEMFEMKVLAMI